MPWAHRPCPDCVRATLEHTQPRTAPHGPAAVLAAWAGAAHAEAVAVRLAVEVLAVALDSLCGAGAEGHGHREQGGAGRAALYAPPWPDAVSWPEPDRSRCLCGLDQA